MHSRNLISKETNLVFCISVYKFIHSSSYRDYDVIIVFHVDSTSLTMPFKKCNVLMI